MLFRFFARKPPAPPVPFNTGFLPEENGHRVFFQEFGRPDGPVILAFHGGPGSDSQPYQTGTFNLETHRVILFDQRGCGQSTPRHAVTHNTAADLVRDAARVLDHVGVQTAVLYGASWGSTLALLFAQTYPQRVSRLILGKTFLARQQDIDWIAVESRRFYPDIYAVLQNDVIPGKTLRRHYADLALSDVAADRARSARLYGQYEFMVGDLNPAFADKDPAADDRYSYTIYMHYDRLDYGLRENQLLDDIAIIRHIPTLILHNRLDLICPLDQSWALHTALPGSKLVIVPEMGHGGTLYNTIEKQEIAAFLAA